MSMSKEGSEMRCCFAAGEATKATKDAMKEQEDRWVGFFQSILSLRLETDSINQSKFLQICIFE